MAVPAVVRGVALDAALLFETDPNGSVQLVSDAPHFLIRMRYSNLKLGVVFREDSKDTVSKKEAILEKVGALEFMVSVSQSQVLSEKEALQKIGSSWGMPVTSGVYITGQLSALSGGDLVHQIQGWTVVHFNSGILAGSEPTTERLHEIQALLVNLNKVALGSSLVVVGHTMKWSRELDFLKRGALPILPNQCGLSFLPMRLDHPFEKQLLAVDVILHKATDEILTFQSEQFGYPGPVQFSKGMNELQRYLFDHPQICVVDPLDQVLPLLDRFVTQAILQSLRIPGQQIVRPPRCTEVTSFEDPSLSQALESGNVLLPAIVKPKIACGASEAHTMAVIFRKEGFSGLAVPLPATIQEYVDHKGFQYKIYVLGNNLLHARRKSTPNAAILAGSNLGAPAMIFDSLKSLPVHVDDGTCGEENSSADGEFHELNLEAVQAAANELRNILRLTIFGFDIVVQSGTNDYVIVDVNYFPSFKDVPDTEAIPAFWSALKAAHGRV